MSLEQKISELSAQLATLSTHVEKLTQALHTGEQDLAASGLYAGEEVKAQAPVEPKASIEPTQPPVAEQPAAETGRAIDFETFKRMCVDAARDPNIGKAKVKEVIASFGAKKAVDIKEADRAAVLDAIGTPF